MKPLHASFTVLFTCFTASLVLLTGGCEIDSGDEVVREVSLSVRGTYTNAAGISTNQTGATITSLSISQSGDQITARDNEGTRWTGTIGRASDTLATITLRGLTTEGTEVVITGTIEISGTTATLTGVWVEPTLTGEVTATASVSGVPTATPTTDPDPGSTPTPTPTPTP